MESFVFSPGCELGNTTENAGSSQDILWNKMQNDANSGKTSNKLAVYNTIEVQSSSDNTFAKVKKPICESLRERYEDKYLDAYDFFYLARKADITLASNSTLYTPNNKDNGDNFLNHNSSAAEGGSKKGTPRRMTPR